MKPSDNPQHETHTRVYLFLRCKSRSWCFARSLRNANWITGDGENLWEDYWGAVRAALAQGPELASIARRWCFRSSWSRWGFVGAVLSTAGDQASVGVLPGWQPLVPTGCSLGQVAKIFEDAGTVQAIPAFVLLARQQQRWPEQTQTPCFASDQGLPLGSWLWCFFFVFGF